MRALWVGLAAFGLLGLSGCSTPRLAYEGLPYLLQWEAQRTWSLDDQQADFTRQRIGVLLEWHRREQLRPLANWLQSVRQQLREAPPPSAETIGQWRESAEQWWQPVAERLAPDLVRLAETLTPAQRARMRARIDDANARWRRDIHPPSARMRASRREERLVERVEWLMGEINSAQRETIREYVREASVFDALIEAERMGKQTRLLGALDSVEPGELAAAARTSAELRFAATLERLWRPDPARIDQANRFAMANDALYAKLFALASASQRSALDRRLAGWIEDLNTLANRSAKRG